MAVNLSQQLAEGAHKAFLAKYLSEGGEVYCRNCNAQTKSCIHLKAYLKGWTVKKKKSKAQVRKRKDKKAKAAEKKEAEAMPMRSVIAQAVKMINNA